MIEPSKAPEDLVDEQVSIITSKLKSKIQLEKIVEEEVAEEITLHR